MKTRLNLTIDENLLEKVKRYAAQRKSSVSELVETYFRTFAEIPAHTGLIDMIEKLPQPNISPKGDLKKQYMDQNASKYGF